MKTIHSLNEFYYSKVSWADLRANYLIYYFYLRFSNWGLAKLVEVSDLPAY